METIGNEEKDKALLLANREEMKKTPVEMTLFRYLWHDRPGIEVGLASFQLNAQAKIDTERARILGAKLGVDALLFCQVGDMEVHEGVSLFRFPRLFSGFKSTSIHLYITLVSAQDGEILWQARARGLQSHEKDESVEGGSIGESYRTQVLAQPCTIFWQTEGWAERLEKILATHNHADHAYPSELRMAIEGAMEAVKSLTDDLYNGTGKVLKTALTAIGS